ncbi:type VI secretion system contractile sheath small subunit [Danxiaibacter flavus]
MKPENAHGKAHQQATSQITIPQIKLNTMAMYNYGVGGNEVKIDSSEAINEIPSNKTLLVSQLTSKEPLQPDTVAGLKTVDDVFTHFKPSVKVELENTNGEQMSETLSFSNLGDFTPANITRQSTLLNTLNVQQEQYARIMKQLKSNRVLQTLLSNDETKEAIINAIKQGLTELEPVK